MSSTVVVIAGSPAISSSQRCGSRHGSSGAFQVKNRTVQSARRSVPVAVTVWP
jgi:hypothetical protein